MIKYILLFIVLTSCAIFPKNKIPTTKFVPPIEKKKSVSLVLLSTHIGEGSNNIVNFSEMYNSKKYPAIGGMAYQWEVKGYVKKSKEILMNSGLFNEVLISSSPEKSKTDLTVEINSLSHGGNAFLGIGKGIWLGISAGTLGIIPYWGSNEMHLNVKLYKGGKAIKTYVLSDKYYSALSILLIPLTPFFWPNNEIKKIRENAILFSLSEMATNKLLDK